MVKVFPDTYKGSFSGLFDGLSAQLRELNRAESMSYEELIEEAQTREQERDAEYYANQRYAQ